MSGARRDMTPFEMVDRIATLERELAEARAQLKEVTEWSAKQLEAAEAKYTEQTKRTEALERNYIEARRELAEAREQGQVFEDHCNHASLLYRDECKLREVAEAQLAAVARWIAKWGGGGVPGSMWAELRAALAPPAPAEPKEEP